MKAIEPMLEDYGLLMPVIIGGGLMVVLGGAALVSSFRKGYDTYGATDDYLEECRRREREEKRKDKIQM